MNEIFITAEIGINANGDVQDAKSLIRMAKQAGCDAVKFQKRDIDAVYSKEFLDSPRKSPWGTTQRQQKEGLEFTFEEYKEIDYYCCELGIDWYASAWDIYSQRFLNAFNLKYNKIASAMLTNKTLCEMVSAEGKLTFISTGMSTWEQVCRVTDLFELNECPYVLLHCVSLYPCPDELCNLRVIPTLAVNSLAGKWCVGIGYSGHELGILPSVIAVVLGARYIERHITLDRASYGSDQSASLEKKGLETLVRDCRSVVGMLGDGEKGNGKEMEVATKLRYFKEWED